MPRGIQAHIRWLERQLDDATKELAALIPGEPLVAGEGRSPAERAGVGGSSSQHRGSWLPKSLRSRGRGRQDQDYTLLSTGVADLGVEKDLSSLVDSSPGEHRLSCPHTRHYRARPCHQAQDAAR